MYVEPPRNYLAPTLFRGNPRSWAHGAGVGASAGNGSLLDMADSVDKL